MIDNIKKDLCTGCDACYNICLENCITMVDDELGFRYPNVDYDKCTKCKQCIQTCPSLIKTYRDDKWDVPKIFAAWSLNEDLRRTSTSGGIFSELAKKVISNNGLVVGARYNGDHFVEHYITDNLEGVEELKQSKYVQSNIGEIFQLIKDKLEEGNKLAFCGSPCQVAGLLNFLKKPYKNLITFDFVCRGTNSPKAYKKYLEMLKNKYKSDIKKVWFKNKSYGWNRFSTKIEFNNGKNYIKDRYHDLYMRGYIEENLYMRSCCFDCKYKDFPRIADITLADFWGVGKSNPTLDPDKGTSLVMINSNKGLDLFNKIADNIFIQESHLNVALPNNVSIVKSAARNEDSNKFLAMLDSEPFDVCFKKYAKNTGIKRLKSSFRRKASRLKKQVIGK